MLTIRLSRVGKKNKPTFRLIISEKAHDPYGRALEILGSYNPHTKDLQAKKDRILYWLDKGASMSASVNNLLINKELITGDKEKNSRLKSKKQLAKKKGQTEKKQDAQETKKEESTQKEEKEEESKPKEEK